MNIGHEVLNNSALDTKVSTGNCPEAGVSNLDIEVLINACIKRGVPIEEHIAKYIALTAVDAEIAEFNPIRLHKEQVDVLLKLLNKKIPDLKAYEHSGKGGGPIPLLLSHEDAGVL